jgi:hypothetical protein
MSKMVELLTVGVGWLLMSALKEPLTKHDGCKDTEIGNTCSDSYDTIFHFRVNQNANAGNVYLGKCQPHRCNLERISI